MARAILARDAVSGVILAGGQARRMRDAGPGPIEKGLLVLHDEPLAAWVHHYLKSRVGPLYISANRCTRAYSRYGEVVADDPGLGQSPGPLAGLASVMARTQTPWLLALPVDVPAPPDDLLERLAEQAFAAQAAIAYAYCGRDHPLCMLAHRSMLSGLRNYLLEGGRKVGGWQESNGALPVVFRGDEAEFFNINTPADLVRAAQLIAPPGWRA